MKNTFGTVGSIIVALAIVAAIGYGTWQLKRKLNYKFSYQSQVQAELKPLREQVKALEARVANLETNAIIPFIIANTNK